MNTLDPTTSLMMAFDCANRAFTMEARPGWDRASADLIAEIERQASPADAARFATPVGFRMAVLVQLRAWVDAMPDIRRGLTTFCDDGLKILARWERGELAEKEAPHGVAVR